MRSFSKANLFVCSVLFGTLFFWCTSVVAQTGTIRTININIFGGSNPYNNTAWNNWNEPANRISPVLKYADGVNSAVTITSSTVFAVTDNGTPYPTIMCPPEVGRYALFSSTTSHTLTFNNLKTDGTVYDLDIYASRKNTGNTTRFTVSGRAVDINTASNYSNAAQFTSLVPNSSGQIIITITRTSGTYAYVNGLKLVERSGVPNVAPVANAGNDQSVTLPANSVLLTGSGTDTDGTIAAYQWSKVSGPSQFTLSSSTAAQTTVSNLVQGQYSFELRVTDNGGAVARDTVTITVQPAPPQNQLPVANAGADIAITLPLNSVQLNGTATDADGTVTAYLWTKISGPSPYNISATSAAQTAVTDLVPGVYRFEMRVTDNEAGIGRDTVTVTVYEVPPPNQPPVANAGNNLAITLPISSVTLNGSGTDTDGSIASFAWSKVAGPEQFNILSTATAQTSVTGLVQGSYSFELLVTDNEGAFAKDTVVVIVNAAPPPNQLPVANAGNNQTVFLPTNNATLAGSGTDTDGTIASYLWTKISGPTQFTISSASSAQTTVTNLAQGVYGFALRVTDNQGGIGRDTVLVTVSAYSIPLTDASAAQTITHPVSSVTVTSAYTLAGASLKNIRWSKTKVPGHVSKKVVWIGSSTVAGTGATTQDSAVVWRVGNYYRNMGVMSSWLNLGVSGANVFQGMPTGYVPTGNQSAPDVTHNVTYALSQGADVVIVGYPSNAYEGTLSITEIMFAYRTIYNTVVNAGKKCYIMTSQPRPAFGTVGRNLLKEIADSIMLQYPNNYIQGYYNLVQTGTHNMLYNSGDNIHQNNTGHRVLFNSVVARNIFETWTGSAATILSPATSNTVINDLPVGKNIFQVTVTDTHEQSITDTVTITVNGEPVVRANAGADRIVNLPATSATLDGSNTTGANNYAWLQLTGPVAATIATPAQATTLVSGLGTAGTYSFQLSINNGASRDTVLVTVNNVPYGIPVADAGAAQTIVLPTSSATVNSSYTLRGATLKTLRWSKTKVPGQASKKVVWIGSSTIAGSGATTEDSALVWRVGNYYTSLGIMSSWLNLGITGANIYQGMPSDYTATGAQSSPDVTHNVTYALNEGADVVIVGYPSNAYDGTLTIGEIMFAYRTIYNTVVNAGRKCYIMTSQPRSDFEATGRNMLKEVADSIMLQFPDHYIQAYYNLVETGTQTMLYNAGDNIHQNNIGHRVLFNSVIARNIFETWATSSSSIVSPTTGSTSITNLPLGKNTFQVTVTDTHEQSITDTVTVTVNPEPGIAANAGPDQNINLPIASIVLNGSNSTRATSYLWTQLTGPSVAGITTASAATTTVTGLQTAGTYSFELAINGGLSRDTVYVFATLSTADKVINVNIFGGSNPYNNSAWNNWNEPANRTSQILTYADGISSGVTITTSTIFSVTDNGATYPTTMCPPAVGRYAMFSSTTSHTLTFNNLKTDGTMYNLDIYASRNNTGNSTRFTVSGRVVDINTSGNYVNAAQFTNLLPNASGQLVITITRAAGTYAYVNGLKLTEVPNLIVSR